MTGLKVSPEPAPNFTTAREVLGIAWPLHYIFFGIFFAIFFFYTLINIINLLRSEMFQRRKIFLFINGMLCFLCFVMASSLFLDPYDSGEHFEEINFHGIVFTIVGLRVPCITASFSLTQISLLEATKLQLYSKKLQSYTFISFVIGFHFILVFTVDVILTVFAGTIVFLLVCQVFFLFIGVVMSATSIYSGLKVISHYSQSKITLQQHNQFDMESFRKNNPSKIASEVTSPHIFKKPTKSSDIKQVIFQDKSMRKIAALTICTAIFSLGISGSHVYSFTLNDKRTPDVVNWFVLQNLFRISEGGMVATMAYIVRRNISSNCCKCWS